MRGLTSVLDYLICSLGLGVCECSVALDSLVGGNWNNTSRAGLWYWWFNEASSYANANIGARLIIFKIHIKGFGVFGTGVYLFISFSSCRR